VGEQWFMATSRDQPQVFRVSSGTQHMKAWPADILSCHRHDSKESQEGPVNDSHRSLAGMAALPH